MDCEHINKFICLFDMIRNMRDVSEKNHYRNGDVIEKCPNMLNVYMLKILENTRK